MSPGGVFNPAQRGVQRTACSVAGCHIADHAERSCPASSALCPGDMSSMPSAGRTTVILLNFMLTHKLRVCRQRSSRVRHGDPVPPAVRTCGQGIPVGPWAGHVLNHSDNMLSSRAWQSAARGWETSHRGLAMGPTDGRRFVPLVWQPTTSWGSRWLRFDVTSLPSSDFY